MPSVLVDLSTRGLANIRAANSFKFTVGDLTYACPICTAEFLSPAVGRLRQVDPTLFHYRVSTPDPLGFFDSFLALGRGDSLEVNDQNRSFVFSLARELKNSELYFAVLSQTDVPLDFENLNERMRGRSELGINCDQEIAFLASKFYECPESILLSMDVPCLSLALCHPGLKLASEDSLAGLIAQGLSRSSEYSDLLQYVQFDCLSAEAVSKLTASTADFLNMLNSNVWEKIRRRLSLPIEKIKSSQSPSPRYVRPAGIDVPFRQDAALDGIVAYLTRECGGNVHEREVVTISASSGRSGRDAPRNTADLTADSVFVSANTANQWLCYDFKNRRVLPSYYTLRSNFDGQPNWSNPKSWVVEISDDGVEWVMVDVQQNTCCLNDRNVVASFPIRGGKECRMVRLRQTDLNHSGTHFLVMSSFEVFGTLAQCL
jgi:hypothetical protein